MRKLQKTKKPAERDLEEGGANNVYVPKGHYGCLDHRHRDGSHCEGDWRLDLGRGRRHILLLLHGICACCMWRIYRFRSLRLQSSFLMQGTISL